MKPDIEFFQNRLSYDPDTGQFRWKISIGKAEIGAIAGGLNDQGYVIIGVGRRHWRAHRLAWLFVKGHWPSHLDHINQNRSDNRWINLREATSSQNKLNTKPRKDNKTSGVKNVSYSKRDDLWYVCAAYRGQRIRRSFMTFHEAAVFAETLPNREWMPV